MDGFDRIYDLHRILKSRKQPLPLSDILREMECSRATFNRVKRHMTDFLGAPIEYSRERGGYFYNEGPQQGYELPGLWLNEGELQALLLIQGLLEELGVGLVSEAVYPLQQRFQKLLRRNAINPSRVQDSVRLLGVASRNVDAKIFMGVAEATLRQQVLFLKYRSLGSGMDSERTVSPQRIIHYRHNWYLDAWCHLRERLRTFALTGIAHLQAGTEKYHAMASAELDAHFQGSYGLFSAENIAHAVLRFSSPYAQRAALEQWHPLQKGEFLEGGDYQLVVPYNRLHPQELLMDILRVGEYVEVLEPADLRSQLQQKLQIVLKKY